MAPLHIDGGEYLTVREAMTLAGVGGQRIRQLCATSQVGAVRIAEGRRNVWLIPAERLRAWMATRRVGRPTR